MRTRKDKAREEFKKISKAIADDGQDPGKLLKDLTWKYYYPPLTDEKFSVDKNAWKGFYNALYSNPTISNAPQKEVQKEPDLPVRKSSEPIIGIRTWNLNTDIKLESITSRSVWEGPVFHAEGKPSNQEPEWNPVPEAPEVYGIYAYNNLRDINLIISVLSALRIVGIVELYGKVVIHDYGMRGEICVIKKLLIPNTINFFLKHPDLTKLIEDLETTYDCEVTLDPRRFFNGTDWNPEGSS